MKTIRCEIVMLSILFLALAAGTRAQQPKQRQSDVEHTSAGDLKITPLSHASILLGFAGKAIYVDPVGQVNDPALPKADLILITHTHGDHLDPKALAALKLEQNRTQIVAPAAALKTVPEAKALLNGAVETVRVGEVTIKVEAVPMYNLTRGPSQGQLYHPKGDGNGYILTMGGKRIYVAGDTECVPEMKGLQNIDVAFICMNLPYTMTPLEAAECVLAFHPKIVYPYHYRGQDLQIFAERLSADKGIEVRLRSWY